MDERTVVLVRGQTLGWGEIESLVSVLTDARMVSVTSLASDARQFVKTYQPDMVITAAVLPDGNLFEQIAVWAQDSPHTRIIVLADTLDLVMRARMTTHTVVGYLLWREHTSTALAAHLTALLQGDVIAYTRSITEAIMLADRHTEAVLIAKRMQRLSLAPREAAILRGLREGQSERQIASSLNLSLRTVQRLVAALQIRAQAPTLFVLGTKLHKFISPVDSLSIITS